MTARLPALRGGVAFGTAVVVLQITSVGLGLDALFPILATLVELVALGLVLWTTRSQGFRDQVLNGWLATVVSLPFVALGFVLAVYVLFPSALPAAREALRADLVAQGADPATIEATLAATSATMQGAAGLIGTLATGLVVSPLLAAFLRNR
jgi:hypothetical protein